MTIRFTCSECASVLKIKDELAGSAGRCPKCKTKFIVPTPEAEAPVVVTEPIEPPAGSAMVSNSESNQYRADIPAVLSNADETPVAEAPEESAVAPESHAGLEFGDDKVEINLNADPVSEQTRHSHRDIALPFNSDAEEYLSLDDSNTDIDALPPQRFEPAVQHDAALARHPSEDSNDFDDDLDSLPVMISSRLRKGAASAAPVETGEPGKPLKSPDPVVKSSKKAAKGTTEIPFDPLEFLMSDRTATYGGEAGTGGKPKTPDLSLDTDSNDDFQARMTPHPVTRPAPASVATRLTPEKVDLVTAAKMMKKAIKESQAETAHQRELDAKAGFDYGLFFREFGWRGFGLIFGGLILTYTLYVGSNQMWSSKLKLPKLGYVTGTIKVNGEPLTGAEVYFAPVEAEAAENKRDRIRTSVGVTDAKGHYVMMYVPADRIQGVAVGRCRMWVSHIGERGNDIPSEYSEAAMLVREITEGSQKAPFDLDMTSTKRK